MRDINFFEPYLFQEQKAEEKKPLYTLIKALLIILIVAIPAGILGAMLFFQADTAKMEAELSSPEMKEKLKRIEEKQHKLVRLQEIQPILEKSDSVLKSTDFVDDKQLQAIAAAVPQNLVLVKTLVGVDGCEISGTARKKEAVAELEYNLRQSGLFESFLIKDLALLGDAYEFDMTFEIKGVQPNETNKKRK